MSSALESGPDSHISPGLCFGPAGQARSLRREYTVEVLGPAGAGKTTVVKRLQEHGVVIRSALPLSSFQKCKTLCTIVSALGPAYVRTYPHSRWFTIEELRRMLYVKAWLTSVAQPPDKDVSLTLLDHGPIFMLGMIQEFGPEIVSTQQFARWSQEATAAWSAALDLVLWLDAPDHVLAQRIDKRERQHVVKGVPSQDARMFLERCRRSFEKVLSEITGPGIVQVLRFDTSKVSTDQVVAYLLQAVSDRKPVEKDQGRFRD